MKKILIASLALAMAGSASAATSFTTSSTAASLNSVAPADCALLSDTIKINSSASNIGAYACDATTSNVGVSFGNTSGKGKYFSASSAGGSIVTGETSGGIAPVAGDVEGAADTAAAES